MMAFDASYTRYQLQRSALRKLVRRVYLRSAIRKLRGPTIDFGCGIGEMLERLPAGSVGLEINPVSVAHCRSRGLDAELYDGSTDGWALGPLFGRADLRSMVISHVLEHLDDPVTVLQALLKAAQRLGITRVLVIVPGARGYAGDPTHRTFVDLGMLSSPAVVQGTGFRRASSNYFPGNVRALGGFLRHHELQVLFRA